MKILITGVGGFIGRHLARYLNFKGHDIFGIDAKDPQLSYVKMLGNNILDHLKLKDACQDMDIVIHLAAIAFVPNATNSLARSINYDGTKNIVHAFLQSDAKKFIFASTGKVYGNPQYLPIDEQHPIDPVSDYAKAKADSEEYIKHIAKSSGKEFIIFRQFNIFGPDQSPDFLVSSIIHQAKNSNVLHLGNLDVKRDFTYIDDLLMAYSLAIRKTGLQSLSIFNLGFGISRSVKEIVEDLSKVMNKELTIKVTDSLVRHENMEEVCDNTLIKEVLGWVPAKDFEQGLKQSLI